MTEKRLVKLSSVTRSQRWQVRVEIDEETVRRYVTLLESGGEFDRDPIVWVDGGWEGGFKTLLDGFHRVAAYERVGRDEIMVEGFEGTREEAEWIALTANTRHGKQFTQKDARRAIERALVLNESRSNHELARIFSVSHVTVGNIRKELETAGRIQRADVRMTADGRTMNTAQIGANQQREHWAIRRGQEFWVKARRFGLVEEIRAGVLEAIQPGAVILSDLLLSFDEAVAAMVQFARKYNDERYPVGGYASHITTSRVGRVENVLATVVNVFDERNNDHAAWMIDGVRPATEAEHTAYLNRGRQSSKPADPVASAPRLELPRPLPDSNKLFVRLGHVVGYSTYRDGDMLAVVTSEPYLYEDRISSCLIKHLLPNGSETTGNVALSSLFDPVTHFVRLPGGEIGIIQSVRDDRLSVTRPNADGGNQTNTLLWTNCTLVLLAKGQRVKTRTGRIGELVEDQNGRLLKVRDLETGIISEHVWQTVIPMPTLEPIPASAEETQAETTAEDDLSFADDLVDALMETFSGDDIQEIIPSLAIALLFAEGNGVASPTVIQHIEAVASWFLDIARTAMAEVVEKQNAPAG